MRQSPQIAERRPVAWQERSRQRCPVSHSLNGVTAHLRHPQGISLHGLLWDLSRSGACVQLNQITNLERGEELLLVVSPSLGVEVVEIQAEVCWSDCSTRRMYLGLFFHQGEIPANRFLEFIIKDC